MTRFSITVTSIPEFSLFINFAPFTMSSNDIHGDDDYEWNDSKNNTVTTALYANRIQVDHVYP